jgi:hypothetical protein
VYYCNYILLSYVDIKLLMSILVEEQEEEEAVVVEGVPVCGANFSSAVVDTVYYIDQIHYKIGNRLYIENAD